MLTSFSLEYIGEDGDAYGRMANSLAKEAGYNLGFKSSPPWVALITGRDPKFTYARKFQRSQKDYSHANSVGSRGVYLHFALKDGIYQVSKHESWKRTRRYFIRVHEAAITEITEAEVEAWLNSQVHDQEPQEGDPEAGSKVH